MGTMTSCCNGNTKISQTDPFAFTFNSDPQVNDIYHQQALISKDGELQKILKTYQDKLRDSHSLYIQPNSRSNSIVLKSKENELKCKYLRPFQFLKNQDKSKSYPLVGDQKFTYEDIIVRDSIMQFFGCFLCFLAENQHLLKDIIITQQNNYGLQVVKLKNYDKKQFLIFDDLIVCEGGKPLFVQPIHDKYMWPCILEKAWLKIKGSRSRKIFKSSPQQVVERFFNFPIQKIVFEKEQEQIIIGKIKKYFYNADAKRIILTSKTNPKHKIGLSNQNFFYVGSFDYENRRLFCIRNPYINSNFRGVHSVVSFQIKNLLNNQLKISQVDKGFIILEQTQFIEQIAFASIIHNELGQQRRIDKIQLLIEQQKFIKFQLKQTRNFLLGLEQKSEFDHLQCQNHYYPISYQLINCSQSKIVGGMENSQACFGKKKTYFLQDVVGQMQKGTYILRLKTKAKTKHHVNIHFYMLVNDKTTIPLSSGENIQNQLKQEFQFVLKQICKKQLVNKLTTTKSINTITQNEFQHIIMWVGDIVLVYIQKTENNKLQKNVQVNFPQLVNLQCTSTSLQKGQYKNFEVNTDLLLIFQKISLTAETQIRKYSIEGY